jgi:hypothetical protein
MLDATHLAFVTAALSLAKVLVEMVRPILKKLRLQHVVICGKVSRFLKNDNLVRFAATSTYIPVTY